ncbi:hypothetical protein ACS0TY_025755 [Phlomoides rotata]
MGSAKLGKLLSLKSLAGNPVFVLIVQSLMDVFTLNILVAAYCRERKVKEAEDFVAQQNNICPNMVTYATLIHGYCLLGTMNKAQQVFDCLVEKGLKPSIVCYNSLINGYCKNGNVDGAWRLFLDVPRKDLERTYLQYPIGKLVQEAADIEAYSFLHTMEKKGFIPDIVTYTILIGGLCKAGKLDVARDLFNQLPSKGLQPDARTYKTIIGALYEKGYAEEARYLRMEMKKKNGCKSKDVTSVKQNVLCKVMLVVLD